MTHTSQSVWNSRKQTIELSDGRSLAFIDTGEQKPTLLLLHGYSDTSRSFSLIEPLLKGFRLVIPDLPGHGESAPGDELLSPSNIAQDIVQLMRTLQIEEFDIVGHSMGAMVGIELAANGSIRATGLVTISGTLRPDFPKDGTIARAISNLNDPIDPRDPLFDDWHICSQPVDRDFLAEVRLEAANMPASIWHRIYDCLATIDLSSSASKIVIPVLCFGGGDDPLFGINHRETLASAFRICRSEVLVGCGHNPHWEDPQRIADLLHRYLDERASASRSYFCRVSVERVLGDETSRRL